MKSHEYSLNGKSNKLNMYFYRRISKYMRIKKGIRKEFRENLSMIIEILSLFATVIDLYIQ